MHLNYFKILNISENAKKKTALKIVLEYSKHVCSLESIVSSVKKKKPM